MDVDDQGPRLTVGAIAVARQYEACMRETLAVALARRARRRVGAKQGRGAGWSRTARRKVAANAEVRRVAVRRLLDRLGFAEARTALAAGEAADDADRAAAMAQSRGAARHSNMRVIFGTAAAAARVRLDREDGLAPRRRGDESPRRRGRDVDTDETRRRFSSASARTPAVGRRK